MSKAIGEERWDELDEEVRNMYRAHQIPNLALRDVYGDDYIHDGSVVDQDNKLCPDYSYAKGKLIDAEITVHYPEIKEVPTRYDEHGYITRPGLIPFPERDEKVKVLRFVPYTPEEQESYDQAQAKMKQRYEAEEANKRYMAMMLPINLMSMTDEMVKSISSIIPVFDSRSNYPEKTVIKFEGKDYRAKSAVQANDPTPDKNDKWYEVK